MQAAKIVLLARNAVSSTMRNPHEYGLPSLSLWGVLEDAAPDRTLMFVFMAIVAGRANRLTECNAEYRQVAQAGKRDHVVGDILLQRN